MLKNVYSFSDKEITTKNGLPANGIMMPMMDTDLASMSQPVPCTSSVEKKEKYTFKPEDLQECFLPVLEKLFQFRRNNVILTTHPMDLSTIKNKLTLGQYVDPWDFVDDVWLIFDNVRRITDRASGIYKCCTKLAEIFGNEIDPVMRRLGYCCGRKYTFYPKTIHCFGKLLCNISKDMEYYDYQNQYHYCVECFLGIPGDTITLGEDPSQHQIVIKKDQFAQMKNDLVKPEPVVDCVDCGRKFHQVCVLHMDKIWPKGFVCDNCLNVKNAKKSENNYSAKKYPVTVLGTYIENRVNEYLRSGMLGAGQVTIRVVSSCERTVKVKSRMKSRFVDTGALLAKFPYKAKTILAFEKIDGVDVCIFGMQVQEYGSECPQPNNRRVYISCFDYLHLIQPELHRDKIYHEILLGYLDYVKKLGYVMAHVWTCNPPEGDDGMFYCHPDKQKILKPKRLQDWFRSMLHKCVVDRVVFDYKSILTQAMEDKLQSSSQLAYFDGDFWPYALEESIKQLDEGDTNVRAKKFKFTTPVMDDLLIEILTTMKKHQESFLVIRLHSTQSVSSLLPIQDPDPLITCKFMEDKEYLLTFCRERNYEFSSLRRAKFSSMAVLYEIHTKTEDRSNYACNICNNYVQNRYYCTQCDYFDLCESCYSRVGHPHEVHFLGLNMGDLTEELGSPEDTNCGLPICSGYKLKIKDLQLRSRLLQDQLLRRRVAAMNSCTGSRGSNSPSISGISSPSTSVQNSSHGTTTFIFKPKDLQKCFLPVLEKLFQSKLSEHFRQPVDQSNVIIPTAQPMDLFTIKNKLNLGQYVDPWDFINDVWLIFDNVWQFTDRELEIYKCCTKLAEIFGKEIDPVMKMLGYCCGRKYTFNPKTIPCFGRDLCNISKDMIYYDYQNKYQYCVECFLGIPGDTICLSEDPSQPQIKIKKDQFAQMKNDVVKTEHFVNCVDCGRKFHQVCVLHMCEIWPKGFVCNNCSMKKNVFRNENKYSAKTCPVTELGTYIETRVNNYLQNRGAGGGQVTIRVVSSCERTVEVKPGMKSRFVDTGELPAQFPYKAKTILAFKKIGGVDVCIFGMRVQEYGSECPQPNNRRVYISCLDSVHVIQPELYRDVVYHEILLGYLDYVKKLGYVMAHIWTCHPAEGDDCMFYCHPDEQQIPKPKQLRDWFTRMLDKGIVERIVIDYKNILKQAMEDKSRSASELAYFDGDFWPYALEESIKRLGQEGRVELPKTIKLSTPVKDELLVKILILMEKHQDSFFVIRLHSAQSAATFPPIQDPDQLITCDVMEDGEYLLTLCREKNYEFSSLRRAKFSSMALLYEIHPKPQDRDRFVYACNMCRNYVETRYHCTQCDDFELCKSCYIQEGHHHKMDLLGLDVDDCTEKVFDYGEARKLSVQKCIQALKHACKCRVMNCGLPTCHRMKRVVVHTKACKLKVNGNCPICKQLIALCLYHAKFCVDERCGVPICPSIKLKMKDQLLQNRILQAQHLRRKVAAMNLCTVCGLTPGFSSSITSGVLSPSTSVQNSLLSMSSSSDSPRRKQPTHARSVTVNLLPHDQEALQQLLEVMRLPSSQQQHEQILETLKKNPQLMAAFISQWQQQEWKIDNLPSNGERATNENISNPTPGNSSHQQSGLAPDVSRKKVPITSILQSVENMTISDVPLLNEILEESGHMSTASGAASNSLETNAQQNVTKDWRTEISPDLRELLLKKTIESIVSPGSDGAPRVVLNIHDLESHVRKEESDIYAGSNSKFEYYDLLSKMNNKIRKELAEKSE